MPEQKTVVEDDGRIRTLAVGRNNEIKKVKETSQRVSKFQRLLAKGAVGLGLRVALGPASLLAMPLIMGVAGAYDPAIVTGKPLGEDYETSASKGFALGATSALPGGRLIQAFAFKGAELIIRPGDELLVKGRICGLPQQSVEGTVLKNSEAERVKQDWDW
ncbi:MAG: hypothetical protein K2X93_09535 [Candidatus Obscuribacterales bacterium]|nr:hypothetical protein [Candidatus Obscuribacterales bacterium]